VAHTWGHLGREFLGDLIGISDPAAQLYSPAFANQFAASVPSLPSASPPSMAADCGLDGQAWSGSAPPKGYKVVNYCGQAVLRKIRRRRRRRMLTASDAADLATIVGIVGKGQMAAALINRRP